jgi:hypothetical protein
MADWQAPLCHLFICYHVLSGIMQLHRTRRANCSSADGCFCAAQELRGHCAMLVRTHNELVEQRNRLLLAAGYTARPRPAGGGGGAETARGSNGGSDGCSVMPETPEHEAVAAGAGSSAPALQLSGGSPITEVLKLA